MLIGNLYSQCIRFSFFDSDFDIFGREIFFGSFACKKNNQWKNKNKSFTTFFLHLWGEISTSKADLLSSPFLMKKFLALMISSILIWGQSLAVYAPTTLEQTTIQQVGQKILKLAWNNSKKKTLMITQLKTLYTVYSAQPRSAWILSELITLLEGTTQLGTSSGVANILSDAPRVWQCQIFPSDNPWNQDVSRLSVHANSQNYIASMLAKKKMVHPDFWANRDGGPFGIPYVVVDSTQSTVSVKAVRYPEESDQGNFPIPLDAPIEKWWDKHVIVIDKDMCKLYELYAAERKGQWREAGSSALFDLKSNGLRPDGWTSADAAGLPIFPWLVRYDEVAAGKINHALRFTASKTQKAYIAPATHYASNSTDSSLPPMGLRLRLKKDYDISWIKGQSRVIVEALKKYGMILADNGSDWYISGAPDSRWSDEDLGQLKKLPGSAFEAIETGPLVK